MQIGMHFSRFDLEPMQIYVQKKICKYLFKFAWYFVSKIVLTFCEKKNVPVSEKNFWNSRLKAWNLQNFWDHENNL